MDRSEPESRLDILTPVTASLLQHSGPRGTMADLIPDGEDDASNEVHDDDTTELFVKEVGW